MVRRVSDREAGRMLGGRISRRRVLGGAGGAAILALVLPRSISRLLNSLLFADDPVALGATPLTEQEQTTLLAFAQVLLPSPAAPSGGGAPNGADGLVRSILAEPASQDAYRAAVELLDGQSTAAHQVGFAALNLDDRRKLVSDLLTPYQQRSLLSGTYYYLTDEGRQIAHLWSAVAQPILAGFYISNLGWDVVGYPHRPGECSNLIDYQYPIG